MNEKLYKLENLTMNELNIIIGCLGQQPYQNVFNLMPKLQIQIASQNNNSNNVKEKKNGTDK